MTVEYRIGIHRDGLGREVRGDAESVREHLAKQTSYYQVRKLWQVADDGEELIYDAGFGSDAPDLPERFRDAVPDGEEDWQSVVERIEEVHQKISDRHGEEHVPVSDFPTSDSSNSREKTDTQ